MKDIRKRQFHTALGTVDVAGLRFRGCRNCDEKPTISPLSQLLPERTSPELLHIQAELATQLPYRQAAALLQRLLPDTGGVNFTTTRNRKLAVGKRIEKDFLEEIEHPQIVPDLAKEMAVGIDAAFVKALPTRRSQRRQLEVLTGGSRRARVTEKHSRWSGISIHSSSNGCGPFSVGVAEVPRRSCPFFRTEKTACAAWWVLGLARSAVIAWTRTT